MDNNNKLMILNNYSFLSKAFLLIVSIVFLSGHTDKTNLLYNGFTARYDVSKNEFLLGVSERKLIPKSSSQYSYTSYSYATGIASWFVQDKITETSHFQLRNNIVTPSRYDYKNSNGKPNDNFSIIFDNKKNTVTRTRDNKELDIAQNKQDLLSFQIAIMAAMQANNKSIKFTIVDNDSIGEYSLIHQKDEVINLSEGDINTQVMESSSKTNKDRYIFWCAKKYNYLPIKIKKIEHSGDTLLIQLNRINGKEVTFPEPPEDDNY